MVNFITRHLSESEVCNPGRVKGHCAVVRGFERRARNVEPSM